MALISFDLDGVLQKNPFRMGRPDGVFGHICRELAPYVPGPDPEQEVLQRIIARHQRHMAAGDVVAAHDWDGIVAAIAREVGYPGQIDVARLVEHYCQVDGLIASYPGAAECMDMLRARGHVLVSVTNGFRRYQEPVQRTLGLLDRFTALVTPEIAGAGKPQADIYRAAEQFGRGPCIHVGDVLPHDVFGAKNAGWLAIYVVQPTAPGYTPMPPSLAALPPWERPAAARTWLEERLVIDRRWHAHPRCELEECMPDAIVQHLLEIPDTVERLVA
ncbi:MAG: HAD family hydrolase [Symbiobacterium sp.]|uniref:HAD family hydrolase n=1 Tax=Symbiobacterium sp. TaxID=1971213 RepID=UPI003463BDAB